MLWIMKEEVGNWRKAHGLIAIVLEGGLNFRSGEARVEVGLIHADSHFHYLEVCNFFYD